MCSENFSDCSRRSNNTYTPFLLFSYNIYFILYSFEWFAIYMMFALHVYTTTCQSMMNYIPPCLFSLPDPQIEKRMCYLREKIQNGLVFFIKNKIIFRIRTDYSPLRDESLRNRANLYVVTRKRPDNKSRRYHLKQISFYVLGMFANRSLLDAFSFEWMSNSPIWPRISRIDVYYDPAHFDRRSFTVVTFECFFHRIFRDNDLFLLYEFVLKFFRYLMMVENNVF